MKDAS